MRYWINTASRDHQQSGVEGKETRLKRLAKGDRIVFYAPRRDKKFTAIGEVVDEAPLESDGGFRRQVTFLPAEEAPIQPLIADLEFIRDKQRWGFPFRRGMFEIGEADFKTIARAMRTLEACMET
jgi:predicted RNA-binding protein